MWTTPAAAKGHFDTDTPRPGPESPNQGLKVPRHGPGDPQGIL